MNLAALEAHCRAAGKLDEWERAYARMMNGSALEEARICRDELRPKNQTIWQRNEIAHARREAILAHFRKQGVCDIAEIFALYPNISVPAIRSDISALLRMGVIVRAAIGRYTSSTYKGPLPKSAASTRVRRQAEERRERVARHIEENPGCSARELRSKVKVNGTTFGNDIRKLKEAGRIHALKGKRAGYYPGAAR